MNACADTLLDELQTPAVRDLAWACFSPALILSDTVVPAGMNLANCGLSLNRQRRDWLATLDQDPRPLLQHLASVRSRRLGLYFEALWHFFLRRDQQVELLAHNLPVRDGARTIGEFDCLYYCHQRQRHFHLELALKFYLGLPSSPCNSEPSQWDCWLGPGAHDRLDLKMDRLLQHQIRLGEHPHARAILQDLGIEQLDREMEIKGRLFTPRNKNLPPPYGYNSALKLCHWTTAMETDSGTDYIVLDKSHWLAPVTPASIPGASIPPARAWGRPLLVAALDPAGNEQERFFLAPEHWPDAA